MCNPCSKPCSKIKHLIQLGADFLTQTEMGVLAKSNNIKPPKDLMLITSQVIGLVGIEEELHFSR
jgi:hypothetical protein